MSKKQKFCIAASVLAAIQASSVFAHLEPKEGDGMEKCYGVVKSGKNDCASKDGKHSCKGMGRGDKNPNEWIKIPSGTCEKLTGGSVIPAEGLENKNKEDDEHRKHDH